MKVLFFQRQMSYCEALLAVAVEGLAWLLLLLFLRVVCPALLQYLCQWSSEFRVGVVMKGLARLAVQSFLVALAFQHSASCTRSKQAPGTGHLPMHGDACVRTRTRDTLAIAFRSLRGGRTQPGGGGVEERDSGHPWRLHCCNIVHRVRACDDGVVMLSNTRYSNACRHPASLALFMNCRMHPHTANLLFGEKHRSL